MMRAFRGGGDSYRPGGDRDSRQFDFTFRANDQLDTRGGDSYASDSYRPNDRSDSRGNISNAPTGPRSRGGRRGKNNNVENRRPGQGQPNKFAPNTAQTSQNGASSNQPPPTGRFNRPQQNGRFAYQPPSGPRRFNTNSTLATLAREKTPELLVTEQSKPGQNKFKTADTQYDHTVEMGIETDTEDANQPPKKKLALEKDVVEARENTAVPKWSNPDVYTALTGEQVTSQSSQKGMTLIQTIRKARIDQEKAKEASALTDNEDFLSLDMGSLDVSPKAANGSHVVVDLTASSPANPKSRLQSARAPKAKNVLDDGDDIDSALGSRKRTADDEIKLSIPAADTEKAKTLRKKLKKPPKVYLALQGAITPQWRAKDEMTAAPWFEPNNDPSTNATQMLDKEILDFFEFVRPKEYEDVIRNDLIRRTEQEINRSCSVARGAMLRSFGSFAAGLYLPNGDMDLVLHGQHFQRTGQPDLCQQKRELAGFYQQLMNSKVPQPRSGTLIANAKVPIIKFVDGSTKLQVDLSFDNATGTNVVDVYRKWKRQYPTLPILASVIKQFLMMRALNDVASGGLGGYSVVCLVVSFLQHSPPEKDQDYGDLLLGFLDFWGNKFDVVNNYVSLSPAGYFPKSQNRAIPYRNPNKRERLCIMDPSCYGNDISGGTSAIKMIFSAFSEGHASLLEAMEANDPTQSVLSRIIGGHYQSYEHQRRHLKQLWDARITSSSSHHAQPTAPGQQGMSMMGQVSGPPAMLGNYSAQSARP